MQRSEAIAITGIGCRFPGEANGPEAFWNMLLNGIDAVGEIPADRWNISSFYNSTQGLPGKTNSRWGGFISGIDQFDPSFFGISPREAASMDPQHRILLETAWESLEDAGFVIDPAAGSNTGVFIGISTHDYSQIQASFGDKSSIGVHTTTGGVTSVAANRISYLFNFKGPSFAVDTACSSSLVAVHLACRSLRGGECSTALVGGVNALLIPDIYVGFSKMSMLSPDGRCKAFDARGNGFVRGEGAGVIVLKPLSAALAEGDRIYAVIRGSAVNQDGRTSSLTMPGSEAQQRLIRSACADAGVEPVELDYIEAHGTGTPVGDPIEASAIGGAIRGSTDRAPCVIGSVKTNIGHLEAGSGIAGIIKTALILKHGKIPPNLHFEKPNPEINFEKWKLRVPVTVESLAGENALAGINSFGFGGTNAHVILQRPPRRSPEQAHGKEKAFLFMISARDAGGLRSLAEQYAVWLSKSGESLADVCHTLSAGRVHHPHRIAIAARTKTEVAEKLTAFLAGETRVGLSTGDSTKSRPLAFVFTGQGPQWWAMGRELLATNAVFQGKIKECDDLFRLWGDWSLTEELSRDEPSSRMDRTSIAQPAIFAIQVALAAWWSDHGIEPSAVIGHSVGEVAAAHLAGVLDLPAAARVIFERGRCMQHIPPTGKMLAVSLSPEEVVPWLAGLDGTAEIAAVNSPRSITLSGTPAALEHIQHRLESAKVWCRFLKVNHAFHSVQMDPIRAELLASLGDITPQNPKLPICSTVSAKVGGVDRFDAEYWWSNVRECVRFSEGIHSLVEKGYTTFLEIGPHPALAGSVSECLKSIGVDGSVSVSLRRGEAEDLTMLASLGSLHAAGIPIRWSGEGKLVELPLHPWHHERYWHEATESSSSRHAPPAHPLLGRALRTSVPLWESKIDAGVLPYLNDHQLNGHTVFPAAAYLEMALAAGRGMHGDTPLILEEVEFQRALFLPGLPSFLRLSSNCNPVDGTFQVDAQSSEGNTWTSHCGCRIRSGVVARLPETVALEEIKARCGDGMTGEASYALFRRNGFHFGETFRRISKVWRRDGEALGEISTGESLGVGDYQIHPAMLDACFQVILSALAPQDSARGLFLPSGVERMRFYRSSTGNLWSHVVLSGSSEKSITATIKLTDEGGRVVALLEGFRCVAIEQTGGENNEHDGCFYQTEWQESGEERAPVERTVPNSWILFGVETPLSVELARLLKSSGDHCGHAKDPDGLEKQLAASQKTTQLIYLPKSSGEESDLFAGEICAELLAIIQKVLTCGSAARLTIVTRGAQSADAGQVSPAHGSLLGLARVVMNEHPGFSCRVIDLAASDSPDDAGALFAELHDLSEEEIALRGMRRLVPRLSRFLPKGKVLNGKDTPFRLEVIKAGVLDQIGFRPLPRRSPSEGEVEIEIQAGGLNFRDVMKALGIYPIEQPMDELLGDECVGHVVAVGDGVEGLEVGDEVIAISPGSFSKFLTVHSAFVVRKPAILSPVEAVTLPVTFLTAHYALNHLARIRSGEKVLIHAAAGGVGLAAIQIARLAGAEIFATAGNEEKRALVARMGAAHVMDSRTLEFSDQVMEITGGGGVDVVLNSLSGDTIARSLSVLSPYGRFLEIGKRDIYQNTRLGLRPFSRNLSFFAIDLSQLLRDRPSFIARMLRELMPRFESRDLHPLPTTVYPIARSTEAFREMAQGKHTGKIVLSHAEGDVAVQSPPSRQITFSPDATYLVTGGVRGFGMAITEWMIERGARNLVLLGASKASARSAKEHLAKFPVTSLNIITSAVDVSDEKAVNLLLSRIEETMPPLKGVIHAAVQWDDGVLQQLTKKRMTDAFGAKAGGAWNLHRGTLAMPLDFFVMISSVSSLVGNPSQGSYAAANAYLDALAHHRRSLDLPALTVNWGHLGDVGYAARHEKISGHLERYGVAPISLAHALAMLSRLLQSNVVQAAAMRIDWARWAEANPRTRKSRRYSMIISPEPSSRETADSGGMARAVKEASGSERLALLETFIRGVGAHVLGASPSGLDPARPLNELGLDSLMGIELVNRIEAELGVPFPTEKIVGGPSIRMLAAILDESLQEAPSLSPRDRTPENQVAR